MSELEQEQPQEQKPVYRMSTGIPMPQDEFVEPAAPIQAESAEPVVANEEAASTVVTEPEAQVEENVTAFSIPNFGDEQAEEVSAEAQPSAQVQVTDWKEQLKKSDPKEILKELGYDEFVADFAEFRKNGGDAYKFLEAKAFDWNNVSHTDLVFDELKLQYPNLSDDKIEKLYQARYKQSDFASDEDREIGLIQLEADAELVRQKRIYEQQQFRIPEVSRPQEVDNQFQYAEQERIIAEQQQQVLQFFREHDATKSLLESKRVAIDLGDNGKFNFNIDKPENLMAVALDGEKWQRAISVNPQEADPAKLIPDVAKLQKIALVALNPNYEKDLVNYGKSLGLKAIIEEGQNARRPVGSAPAQPNESLGEAFGSRAKVSTLGR
ncbi:MAG: hypothetical protein RLZZ196_145 [Bacteroidota bacterium]|jgi:hypothetical protein